MMPALTSGSDDVAAGFNALSSDTAARDNVASGHDAPLHNTAGSANAASGTQIRRLRQRLFGSG